MTRPARLCLPPEGRFMAETTRIRRVFRWFQRCKHVVLYAWKWSADRSRLDQSILKSLAIKVSLCGDDGKGEVFLLFWRRAYDRKIIFASKIFLF